MVYTIYKIVNWKDDLVYVGCTTKPISTRFSAHKSFAKLGLTSKLYRSMREVGTEYFFIESLEIIQEDELYENIRKVEQKWIDDLLPELNTNRAYVKGPTRKQLSHSLKLSTYPSHNHNICGCGGKYLNYNFSRHKNTKKHQTYEEGLRILRSFVVTPYVQTSDTPDNEI